MEENPIIKSVNTPLSHPSYLRVTKLWICAVDCAATWFGLSDTGGLAGAYCLWIIEGGI